MYNLTKKARQLIPAVITVLLLAFATGCEKELHINLKSSPPKLVVQGAIENGIPPYVILNNTFGFFSTVDLSTIQNSFVHDAVITVSDGIKTVTLKEYTIDTAGGNKFYIYTVDTANLANALVGELGKYYTLNIKTTDGKTFSAMTKVPFPKGLDTLWFGDPTFQRDNTPANARELFANYMDPDTPGNYVKYFTNRNNEGFYPAGVFSDEVVNGKPVNNIDLLAGVPNESDNNSDSAYYFYPGDSVIVKWSEIDKSVYDFWNTYEFAVRTNGNPFSSPINVKSNVSNGALGVWAGYGSILYHLSLK